MSRPCHSLEAPPCASLIQPSPSSSHVQYEGCSPLGSRYYALPVEADQRLTASTRAPLTPSVCQVSTPGAVVKPRVSSLICTAPMSSVVYNQTPATQRNAAAGARQASRVESVSTSSVAARSLASSTDRFASCLPVPLLEAVEGFDVDVVETAAGEARTRPPTDVAPNPAVHSDPAATTSATEPTAVPPSCVIAAPSHQSGVVSSGAATVHPGRSSREGRRSRRRPAAGRWGSPSPRRRSPPHRGPTRRLTRPSHSRRQVVSLSEYIEFLRYRQRHPTD